MGKSPKTKTPCDVICVDSGEGHINRTKNTPGGGGRGGEGRRRPRVSYSGSMEGLWPWSHVSIVGPRGFMGLSQFTERDTEKGE